MTASFSGRSLVVAAEPYIDELRHAKGLRGLEGAALLPLPAEAPLPGELLTRVRVIVLEVDAASEPSLARLSQVRVAHPGAAGHRQDQARRPGR